MQLRRVAGGLQELLALPDGKNIATVRGEPFTVDDETGTALLADGTDRFEEDA